jgi:hypothetical protein
MPLLDHFHPPLSTRRFWHSFHHAWATFLASDLNERLPSGYFAAPNVQFGIEIDVATLRESGDQAAITPSVENGQMWAAPAPVLTVPFPLVSDTVEVTIHAEEAGPTLVGAIELISPSNKDRPEHREAFTAKCETYLQQGVGLLIVDVVTSRHANLHRELLTRIGAESPPGNMQLYAAAYRLVRRSDEAQLDIWAEELSLGQPLPSMPLWLAGHLCIQTDFEATYQRTCREQRVG